MRRLIAAIIAIPTLSNGLAMLFAGSAWYGSVLGVPETGPFNPHFVQDIGIAFLVAGLTLGARHGVLATGRRRWQAPASWPRTPCSTF